MNGAPGERIPPTPEDVAIFERNMRRLKRWKDASGQGGFPFARSMRNATGDYLHFAPMLLRPRMPRGDG